MAVRSWKQEFDDKYEELTSDGNIEVIDKANDVILKAIEGLDAIKREVTDSARRARFVKATE